MFGNLNGKGIKIAHDDKSFTYTGDFVNDLMEGQGIYDCDEYTYEGSFKNDVKEGKGKLLYKKSSNFYEGDFSANAINGTGFFKWENQHSYYGTFLNGKMHGKGTYKWPDGGEYTGQYFNNIKEGEGVFKWPNGRKFQGNFINGNPHGIGTLTVNNKEMECEFINGKMNKNYRRKKSSFTGENLQKGAHEINI